MTARSMFGGHGLYAAGVMFGIVYEDALYMKVNDDSRADYEGAGSAPFTSREGQTLTSYYEVPPDVVDSPDLVDWADGAVVAASEG